MNQEEITEKRNDLFVRVLYFMGSILFFLGATFALIVGYNSYRRVLTEH